MTIAPPIPTDGFLDGIAEGERRALLSDLEQRAVPLGRELLREGESVAEMYLLLSGSADVFVRDHAGMERLVGQVGPGDPVGEMALFARQPASATVRTTRECQVAVVDAPAFERLTRSWPRVVMNLGAMLSRRFARFYQHSLQVDHGQVIILEDHGAPPVLAYALACSVAWHTRASTLLIIVGDLSETVRSLSAERLHSGLPNAPDPHTTVAQLLHLPVDRAFDLDALGRLVDEASHRFRHVLVHAAPTDCRGVDGRRARLASAPLPLGPEGTLTLMGFQPTPNGSASRPAPGVLAVPPLSPPDDHALPTGLLSIGTAAGKAIGWAARTLCGLSVGLALGAGSVKGYAHYGAWRALDRLGLRADYVSGTSIGAIIAATYAMGQTADEAAHTMEITSHRAFRPTVPVHALLSNAGVHDNFRRAVGNLRFEDIPTPVCVVAADVHTGQEVWLRRGLVRTAVLASMAIPGVYPPLRMGGYTLVDGGIVNPLPISAAAALGADIVVAISLGRADPHPPVDVVADEGGGQLPSLVETVAKSVEVMQARIAQTAQRSPNSVLVEPDFGAVPSLGLRAFHQGRPYMAPGEAAVEAALPRLQAAFPWLRP